MSATPVCVSYPKYVGSSTIPPDVWYNRPLSGNIGARTAGYCCGTESVTVLVLISTPEIFIADVSVPENVAVSVIVSLIAGVRVFAVNVIDVDSGANPPPTLIVNIPLDAAE